MKRLLLFCLLGVLALDPNPADAQHKMPAKAAKEIIFQTNQLVMQYEQLLQTIALSGSFPSESKTIIEESYGPTKNRIFASKEVIIEDDINPRFTSGNNTTDMAVDKYLSNLDIYYVKTDDPTIFLTEKVISSVKQKTFPYVDVAYTAVYKSKNRQDTLEYQRVRRVLTVRAD